MGPFYNEACWALFVSLEEEKRRGAYIGAFFFLLPISLQEISASWKRIMLYRCG